MAQSLPSLRYLRDVRMVGTIALSFLGLGLALLMLSRLIDRVIFQPTPGVDLRPEDLGVDGEEVFLPAEDGVKIHAFFLPHPDASRALLFLHGNAGNASHRLPNAAQLLQLRTHVLLLDYRGYGRSEGTPSEDGVYADARAGLAHLIQDRGFPESRIVVFGRSLGSAVAVDLARDRPLAGLILESTFPSAADVARQLLGSPVAALVRGRFQSDLKIGRVRCPLLFLHGDRDEIIDFRLGRRLFEMAPGPKAFETIRGAGHNDTTLVGGPPYFARIGRFLEQVAPER
jgi:pimeloyl-ACP methyl ester carboxylesterase